MTLFIKRLRNEMLKRAIFTRAGLLPMGLLVVALGLLIVSAFLGGAPLANRSLDDEALEIGKRLQCPVCQNLAVAYSPSPLAEQMREIIRAKLQAGETREQIIQYFVDRYGEGILWEPPQSGWNLIAWRVPILALIAGATGLLWLLKNWTQARSPELTLNTDDLGEYDTRLEAELERRAREVWE